MNETPSHRRLTKGGDAPPPCGEQVAKLPLPELFAQALAAAGDTHRDDTTEAAELFAELCRRKEQATFQLAAGALSSASAETRSFAALLLGRLGEDAEDLYTENDGEEEPEQNEPGEEPPFVAEIPGLLYPLLEEDIPEVAESAILALGHLDVDDRELLSRLRTFLHSPRVELRQALAKAVAGTEVDAGLELLIDLSRDPDRDTRNWATFGLAQLTDADSEALRGALCDRLQDADEEVRGEALLGLARRGDERTGPALEQALRSESVGELELAAAAQLAAPELLPALLDLRDWWDAEDSALEEAINACRRSPTPRRNT